MCTPTGEETCAGVADEDCDGTECGLWGRLYGDASNQMGNALEVAPNGDVYITGRIGDPGASIQFDGETVLADAANQHFIAKLSADGQERWIRRLPSQVATIQSGTSHYRIMGATDSSVIISTPLTEVIDLGGGPLASDGWGDTAFASLDSDDGSYEWGTTFTGPGDGGVTFSAYGLSPLGEIVIAGHAAPGAVYDGQVIADPSSPDTRVWYGLGFDAATGNLLWSHTWQVGPLENNDTYHNLAFGKEGDIYITGSVSSPVSFGGEPMVPVDWTQGYLAHLDPQGEWVDGGLYCDSCYPEQMVIGPGGEVVISGYVDFYELGDIPLPTNGQWAIFGLSTQYQPLWARLMSEAPAIDLDESGDIGFEIGDTDMIDIDGASFPAIGLVDIVVGRIALDGTLQWYRQLGTPGARTDDISPQQTFRLQPGGKAIVMLEASGAPADFGFGPLPPVGGRDIGVVQLAL